MKKRHVGATVGAMIAGLLAVGCAPVPPAAEPTPEPTATPTPTPTPASAIERWDDAYAFLLAQTDESLEVICETLAIDADGVATRATVPIELYRLDDDSAGWRDHLVWRDDLPTYAGTTVMRCAVDIPASLPYSGDAINGYLAPHGLWFFEDGSDVSGLQRTEISYGGITGSDESEVDFRGQAGKWAAMLAVGAVAETALTPDGTVIEPTDEATASEYLTYVEPVLDWYGYEPAP